MNHNFNQLRNIDENRSPSDGTGGGRRRSPSDGTGGGRRRSPSDGTGGGR
jgi:hypothetical protein